MVPVFLMMTPWKMTLGLVAAGVQNMQMMTDNPIFRSYRMVLLLREALDAGGSLSRQTCLERMFSMWMDNLSPWHALCMPRLWPVLGCFWSVLAAHQMNRYRFHSLLPNLMPEVATWPHSLTSLNTCSLYRPDSSPPLKEEVLYCSLVPGDGVLVILGCQI